MERNRKRTTQNKAYVEKSVKLSCNKREYRQQALSATGGKRG